LKPSGSGDYFQPDQIFYLVKIINALEADFSILNLFWFSKNEI